VHTSAKARLTSVAMRMHCQPSLKISCRSFRKFLRKVANRQTNKQTNKQRRLHVLLDGSKNKNGAIFRDTVYGIVSHDMCCLSCRSNGFWQSVLWITRRDRLMNSNTRTAGKMHSITRGFGLSLTCLNTVVRRCWAVTEFLQVMLKNCCGFVAHVIIVVQQNPQQIEVLEYEQNAT